MFKRLATQDYPDAEFNTEGFIVCDRCANSIAVWEFVTVNPPKGNDSHNWYSCKRCMGTVADEFVAVNWAVNAAKYTVCQLTQEE